MDVCNFAGDAVFNEVKAWPVALAAVYFKTQYVTRNFWATLIFVYVFETFSYAVSLMYRDIKTHSSQRGATAEWFADHVLSWFAAPPSTHMCSDSLAVSLLAAPTIAFLAASLWCVGVEVLLEVHYKTPPLRLQYVLLWLTFFGAMGISSRALFTPRSDLLPRAHSTADTAFNDAGLLMQAIFSIMFLAFIPVQAQQTYGASSVEFARALRAYLVFVVFYLFIVFHAALSEPLLLWCGFSDAYGGVFPAQSSFGRALFTLLILWIVCLLMGTARLFVLALNCCCGLKRRKAPL